MSDLAARLEITLSALYDRRRRYGAWTHPNILLPRRIHCRPRLVTCGTAEWRALGTVPRTENLSKITPISSHW